MSALEAGSARVRPRRAQRVCMRVRERVQWSRPVDRSLRTPKSRYVDWLQLVPRCDRGEIVRNVAFYCEFFKNATFLEIRRVPVTRLSINSLCSNVS